MRLFKPAIYVKGCGAILCCGAVLFLMVLSCCNKNGVRIPVMPDATQTGRNTMGAYVNNTLWVPAISFDNTGIDASYTIPFLQMDGIVEDASGVSKTEIFFNIHNFTGVGKYTLNTDPNNNNTDNSAQCLKVNGEYVTDSLHQGTVIVTHFDDKKHIVSGTFQIKLINKNNPADSVTVSSGRFDVTCPLTVEVDG